MSRISVPTLPPHTRFGAGFRPFSASLTNYSVRASFARTRKFCGKDNYFFIPFKKFTFNKLINFSDAVLVPSKCENSPKTSGKRLSGVRQTFDQSTENFLRVSCRRCSFPTPFIMFSLKKGSHPSFYLRIKRLR